MLSTHDIIAIHEQIAALRQELALHRQSTEYRLEAHLKEMDQQIAAILSRLDTIETVSTNGTGTALDSLRSITDSIGIQKLILTIMIILFMSGLVTAPDFTKVVVALGGG